MNHPLLLETTREQLLQEWMADQMEGYLFDKEEMEVSELTYEMVFPREDFSVMHFFRKLEKNPHYDDYDADELEQAAREMSEKAKAREKAREEKRRKRRQEKAKRWK